MAGKSHSGVKANALKYREPKPFRYNNTVLWQTLAREMRGTGGASETAPSLEVYLGINQTSKFSARATRCRPCCPPRAAGGRSGMRRR
jgi:hypothetical protein